MEKPGPRDWLADWYAQALDWLNSDIWRVGSAIELAAIALVLALAYIVGTPLRTRLRNRRERPDTDRRLALFLRAVGPLVAPTIAVAILWVGVAIADRSGWPHPILTVAVSLLNAWIVIRLVSATLRHREWARLVAGVAWTIAALNILGLLQPAVDVLDRLALPIGEVRISAFTVLQALALLAVLLWLATLIARLLEHRIETLPNITPSTQVLFVMAIKIAMVTVAVLVAVSSVGLDLSVLAVFGGALGVGIGFGLQKIVANFISGIILLLDRSIKPGDTIGVAGTYGRIQSLNARFVSVVTRDGIEHLIPNEDLIVNRVENWTFSNDRVRLKIPVGISYSADVRKAIALCLEAAALPERVLDEPKPVCLLKGYGDSSVDLEIRLWIRDPQNGVSNVKSEVLLELWDLLAENDIEIPFPQRDLHLRSVADDIAWRGGGAASDAAQ